MAVVVLTPPTDEPIALEEAKAHLRVEDEGEDTYIDGLILAAREYCERRQRRVYITHTLEYSRDCFPAERRIELPLPKLQAVQSVTYTTDEGAALVFDPANYVVDDRSTVGSVVLKPRAAWPTAPLWPVNGVVIRYTAGYGNAESVPQRIKQAMYLLIGHWYEHREAAGEGAVTKQLDFAVTALLAQDRVY